MLSTRAIGKKGTVSFLLMVDDMHEITMLQEKSPRTLDKNVVQVRSLDKIYTKICQTTQFKMVYNTEKSLNAKLPLPYN